jgi:hypothetical protein
VIGGTIYLIDPNWHGDPDDQHEAVVKSFNHGRHYIGMAIELWMIAGNEEVSKRLRGLLHLAFERENRALSNTEIDEMIQIIADLDQSLLNNVVDEHWQVPKERLGDLRARCTLIDLDDEGGHIAADGVQEAMSHVYELREFLEEGKKSGLHLALD